MYGTTLWLPDEYFDDRISETNTSDICNYVTKFKLIMQQLKAIPPRSTANRKTYVNNDLLTCTHVFVWHDAIHKPLQQQYDGSFTVIKCTDKNFTIARNNQEEVVSVDRLKPAYIDISVKLIVHHILATHLLLTLLQHHLFHLRIQHCHYKPPDLDAMFTSLLILTLRGVL